MTETIINNFHREMICSYDEERYSVRDNGAVLRHSRPVKRSRSGDNQWTFGKPNTQNGYMHIGSVRIHRIVATAFLGDPPTPEHIVDHIDTNRRNNRPENLRWLTRLENALLNPITVKRIELCCGSIEAFLKDPSKLRNSGNDRNFEWMRGVTPQEAQACLERLQLWAKSDKPPSCSGFLGEWVFKSSFTHKPSPQTPQKTSDLVIAKTPGAAQRNWRTPTEFPCCPQKAEEDSIATYKVKLTAGAIFARNDFSISIVLKVAVADDGQSVFVMCEQAAKDTIKPWSLAKVAFEDGLYVHTSLGTFFTKDGAEKEFCLVRDLEWTGGDTFDDYC